MTDDRLKGFEDRAMQGVRLIVEGARDNAHVPIDEFVAEIDGPLREAIRAAFTEITETAKREVEAAIQGTGEAIARALEKLGQTDGKTAAAMVRSAVKPEPLEH